MRFSEYLIYEGLRQNNLALHALGTRQQSVNNTAVHELRLVVKRLRAYWSLFEGAVPRAQVRDAHLRLKNLHQILGRARDQAAIADTIAELIAKAPSEKVRVALELASSRLQAGAAGANTWALRVPRDLVSAGFQEESLSWRELDGRAIDDGHLLRGYRHGYRHSRRAGLRALETLVVADLHRWRRSLRRSQEQLAVIRPVLSEAGSQTLFNVTRLNDVLGRHRDLWMVQIVLPTLDLPDKQRKRIEGLLAVHMRYARERAAKLYPKCYRYAPTSFADRLQSDLVGLDFVALLAARERAAA